MDNICILALVGTFLLGVSAGVLIRMIQTRVGIKSNREVKSFEKDEKRRHLTLITDIRADRRKED